MANHPNAPAAWRKELFPDNFMKIITAKQESEDIDNTYEHFLKSNPTNLAPVLRSFTLDATSSFGRTLLCLHPDTPSDILTDSADSLDWLERYAVAAHPNTPKAILTKLSEDGNRIVRAAAQVSLGINNIKVPNVQWEPKILAGLQEHLPQSSIDSPIYSSLLRQNPELDLVALMSAKVVETTLQREKVPVKFIERVESLCREGIWIRAREKILEAIVRNKDTSGEILERLATREYSSLSSWIAKHPNATPKALMELAHSKDSNVRRCVASHPNTEPEVLDWLTQDVNISGTYKGGQLVGIQLSVAENPNTSPKTLELLGQSPDIFVRTAVAQHPHTPIRILEQLAMDKDRRVRNCVVLHPTVPTQLVKMIYLGKPLFTCSQESLVEASLIALQLWKVKRLDVPSHVLEEILAHPWSPIRHAIALNPHTPETVLDKLAGDAVEAIRLQVARHPRTSSTTLARLSKDSSRNVELAARCNPNVPDWILWQWR